MSNATSKKIQKKKTNKMTKSKKYFRRHDKEDGGPVSSVREQGRSTEPIVLVIVSDLHLRHTPPIFRSVEPDWYKAMARPLHQINKLVEQHCCPLLIPGDIFDTWKVNAELISFAIKHIRRGAFAIPGQHDLPFHNYKDRMRSPYQTLVEAGTIIDLIPGEPITTHTSCVLHGFPWEHPITRCKMPPMTFGLHVAVAHAYIWTKSTAYTGAPNDQRLKHYQKKLKGYDAAFFGDNHKGFLSKGKGKKCPILNCGSMMVNTSDQRDYRPSVGLLYADGKIERHFLSTKKDKYFEVNKIPELREKKLELQGLLDFMNKVKLNQQEFEKSVIRWLKENQISKEVRDQVMEAVYKSMVKQ